MTNTITPPTVLPTPDGSTPTEEAQLMKSVPETPKRAVLYARVSTDEQARSGFSLARQLESLREYAAREGYEEVEEVSDPGQSGAYLERPGLDRVRDRVEAGGISVVLAQDADRITRDPAHRAFLDDEFERFGPRLFALDDWGDDTHEGELLKLENDLAVVLALYGAYAGADLSLLPPEERRRIYTALGLKATVYSDGRVEIEVAGHPEGGLFSASQEAQQLVERIIYEPEKLQWREEWRARFERLLSKDGSQRKGGVMPCDGSS